MNTAIEIERRIWLAAYIRGLADTSPQGAELLAIDALYRYRRRWHREPVPSGIDPLVWASINQLSAEIDAEIATQAATSACAEGVPPTV